MREMKYDEQLLRRLWDEGVSHVNIARTLGCPTQYVSQLRVRHSLPQRRRSYHMNKIVDPTPEEIEERKKVIRERHFEEMRRS